MENNWIDTFKHIDYIRGGDIIVSGDGKVRTVTPRDIRKDVFMGTTIFGDSWKLGYQLVNVKTFVTPKIS